MKSVLKTGALLACSLLAPVLAGCGGGSGTATTLNTGNEGASRGALSMQINFPSGKKVQAGHRATGKTGTTRIAGFSNGNIPEGTHAVKVEVVTTSSPETSLALPQVITPAATSTNGVTGPVTARFTNLPVGTVRVRATAYPDIAAKLNPIAIGTSDIPIAVNTTANANVALALTIDHIALEPTAFTLDITQGNPTQTLAATPMTRDNKPLLMPLLVSADRTDVISVGAGTPPANTLAETAIFLAQPVSPTSATFPATATITIAEPNSGKTVTATATVTFTPE